MKIKYFLLAKLNFLIQLNFNYLNSKNNLYHQELLVVYNLFHKIQSIYIQTHLLNIKYSIMYPIL